MDAKHIMPKGVLNNLSVKGTAGVLYGVLTAIIAVLLLSFIGSAIVYFSSLSESWLYIFAVVINVLAIFCGGFIAGRKAKNRGLIRGLIVAALVIILMLITGNMSLAQFGMKLAYCLPAGALGGICGVK